MERWKPGSCRNCGDEIILTPESRNIASGLCGTECHRIWTMNSLLDEVKKLRQEFEQFREERKGIIWAIFKEMAGK